MNSQELLYEAVRLIPQGKVMTYGALGRLLNLSPRAIGRWLHQNPRPKQIPCHRVVFNDGRLAPKYAFGGKQEQEKKLKKEGVIFQKQQVALEVSLFQVTPVLRYYFGLLKKFGWPGKWPWTGGPAHRGEEIIIGALLTQRTSWRNAELALINLQQVGANNLLALSGLDRRRLENLIRPSGFYRQKAGRLSGLARSLKSLKNMAKMPNLRDKLLSLSGIGPETADTILLYALDRPTFVVDEYTRRFVRKFNLSQEKKYERLQRFFTDRLPQDVLLFQRYHALIVLWGKTTKNSPTG